MSFDGTLAEHLDELVRPTGFAAVRIGSLPTIDGYEPEVDWQLWESPYALLLLAPVAMQSGVEGLRRTREPARRWLEAAIATEEKEGRILDSYLLLALDEPPDEALRDAIPEIEQDPSWCRKHVLWPMDDDSTNPWQNRLEQVTILSLAATPSPPAEPARIPKLPELAAKGWEHYQEKESNSVEAVKRMILEDVRQIEGEGSTS
jgi:hypothetical protein